MSDSTTNGEMAFFRYRCSENNGMVTLVELDSENLHHYENRECETLCGIEWWLVDTDSSQ